MTSEVLDNLRITRQIEISSLKCDLLDLTGDEAKRMERVRRMRERLTLLSDCIESDYKEVSAVLKRREREIERQRIQTRISDLKAEIRDLEAKL